MKNFDERLKILIKIYNIPIEENWTEFIGAQNYTIYNYWETLGLLNKKQLEDIYSGGRLKSNPIIETFFRTIDYHFKVDYYRNGNAADVGSGFGFITFWLVLSGAKRVYTIGDQVRIEYIKKLYGRAAEKGLIEPNKIGFVPEFVKTGATSLAYEIKDDTLDMVLLNDTLEHIAPRIFPSLVEATY